MDAFLRSLSLDSSTTVEDVTYPCMKILDWVNKTSLSANHIFYKDVENIGKGVVYLNCCYSIFKEDLPKHLLEQFPFFEQQVKEFFGKESPRCYKSIAHVIEKLSQSTEGLEITFILESILNAPFDTNKAPIPLEYSLDVCCKKKFSDYLTNTSKMHRIVNRIFQLPDKQVDIAIDRMLDYMPFSIIGQIFCEPEESVFTDACVIISHKVCAKLLNGQISKLFLHSLYLSASVSETGKNLFWLCLKNENFKNGIIPFFINTLSHLSKQNLDFDSEISVIIYKTHRLSEILYLIWVALSPDSPCHSELYEHIQSSGLTSLLYFLIKFERIYE